MTGRSDFTEDEWARIIRAPFVAGMVITLADPGGPIEAAKEAAASVRSATNPPTREQLVAEVALDIQAQVQQHHNPAAGFRPTGSKAPGELVLDELREVHALVASKASAPEASAFSAWLVATAQDAANAAKEGGFMGFHAERVSEREQDMIGRVRDAVS